ncbi:MAG: hybrid sensor histidine kinase/response regulator [Polyangiaceae bacterium]
MNQRMKTPDAPNILVVDDTPANLTLLCDMLRARGYRARPVPSGELALQAALAQNPDLFLLDISMPGMNGFELCSRLKSEAQFRDTPVIFLTAHTDSADKVKAFSVGGVDYITKPFQIDEVHVRVETHLRLCQQKRELQESYDCLSKLEKMRDELVHMLVHDLRSPLMALWVLLDDAHNEAKGLRPDLENDLESCLDAVQNMGRMVSSVLDVSKMEAEAMTLNPEECDLASLARDVIAEMRGLIGERKLIVRGDASVPILADKDLILRVIQNLLGNALKFTGRRGEIRFDLTTTNDTVRFAISDDGPGVPKELKQKIFEKFGQLECQKENQRHSTGLGLTFCKLAIETHGGSIDVESDPGQGGSTFWFTLPRETSH